MPTKILTAPAAIAAPSGVLAVVEAWAQLAKERRDLASLDARALADIGVSEADARTEASRPFWDAPKGRR